MNFIHTHHYVVAIAAGIGGLLVILVIILLSRKRKPVDTFAAGEVSKIEERLATGHFSRKPSAFRRKVVDIQESRRNIPVVEEKKEEPVPVEAPVEMPIGATEPEPLVAKEVAEPEKPEPFLTPGVTPKSNLFLTPEPKTEESRDKEEGGSR